MAYKDPCCEAAKASKRKHYYANKEAYIARAKAKKIELHELVKQLKSVPCTDCKLAYPWYVMQFDHLGDKDGVVGDFVRKGNKRKLLAEIAKCEVVCANCHAERTYSRLITT